MVLWDLPLVAWYPVMIYPPMTGQTFSPEALWPVTTISQTAHDLLFKDQLNSQHTTSVYCNLAELSWLVLSTEHSTPAQFYCLFNFNEQWRNCNGQKVNRSFTCGIRQRWLFPPIPRIGYKQKDTPVTVQFRSYICNFNCSRVSAKTWQKQIIDQPKW